MSSIRSSSDRLPLRELAVLALLAALTFGGKIAMAGLPNIEPVTLLLAVTTLVYGRRAFYTCFVYVLLEGLVYGFGLWWFSYLYVWPLWVGLILLMRKDVNYLFISAAAAVFGLCFGALFSIPYLFTGGWQMAVSYWAAGIPYDLIHGAGNVLMSALLLKPLHRLVRQLAFSRQ